jgi:hypothetical protein
MKQTILSKQIIEILSFVKIINTKLNNFNSLMHKSFLILAMLKH